MVVSKKKEERLLSVTSQKREKHEKNDDENGERNLGEYFVANRGGMCDVARAYGTRDGELESPYLKTDPSDKNGQVFPIVPSRNAMTQRQHTLHQFGKAWTNIVDDFSKQPPFGKSVTPTTVF